MVSPENETPGVLNKASYTLHTYSYIYTIFERKGTPSVYLLLTNSNPFHILILELGIPLTAVIA